MLKIGAATRIITNELGRYVQGACDAKRATEVLDNLEANGLYLSNGNAAVLFVSCDLAGLETPFVVRAREAMALLAGVRHVKPT